MASWNGCIKEDGYFIWEPEPVDAWGYWMLRRFQRLSGMPDNCVTGIAGGETALRHPVENAEDDTLKGWEELQAFHISDKDTVIGIAASGTTPYVIGALQKAREEAY